MTQIRIKDLEPGQNYIFQARAKDRSGGTSSWSTVFNVLTTSDVTAPAPPTSLSWVVNGSSFLGTWTKPTLDSNGNPLKDFKDYQVTVTADGTSKIYNVSQERFDFSFEANVGAFGSPEATVQISVKARDMVGNLSTAVTQTTSNPNPADLTNLTAVGIPEGININWDASAETDLKAYEVYIGLSSGFTPGPSNLVYTGLATSFTYASTNEVTHYIKARAVDLFNQGSNYATANAVPKGATTPDTDPPDDITTVGVTTGATATDSYIDVTWTLVAATDVQYYLVRYSTDGVSWEYIQTPNNVNSLRITRLIPSTNYYVSVQAVDFTGNASAWTNATVYPIQTAADTTAPSKPQEPTIVAGPLSIQFSQDGTKDAGGDLESDTEYFEVHASTTSGFTPSDATLITTVPFAGPGLDSVARIIVPVADSISNVYWKIKAVDTTGNKSTPSEQVTALPGLIENAYIQNATITDAKIGSVSAAKLQAGTAIVNQLYIREELIIDSVDGEIKSDNFSIGSQTGYRLNQSGLIIYDGTISAETLQLQDSVNLIPPYFADFEWNTEYYHDASNTPNSNNLTAPSTTKITQTEMVGGSRFGTKALRIFNTSTAGLNYVAFVYTDPGTSELSYNILVEGGLEYIISFYAKNNSGNADEIRVGFDYNPPTGDIEQVVTLNAGTSWQRYHVVITLPVGVTEGSIYLEMAPGVNFDFYLDGLQVERKVGGINDPSPWTPPSTTIINGGSIVTGTIRSSASAVGAPTQPAWSLNTDGGAQFGDLLVRGSAVIGAGGDLTNSFIKSSNYSTGVDGWIIRGDGTVEFNDGLFRGGVFLKEEINSEDFELNIDNADARFASVVSAYVDGVEPVLHMKGWELGSNDAGATWTPKSPVQSVVRLTPTGRLQILSERSHDNFIFDIDGYDMFDTVNATQRNEDYGFSSQVIGPGSGTVGSLTEYAPASLTSNNSYMFVNKVFAAQADYEDLDALEPRMQLKYYDTTGLNADTGIYYDPSQATYKGVHSEYHFLSPNKIGDGWDEFDNAGGISYYSSNTYRNRIDISEVRNAHYAATRKNMKGLRIRLLTTGSGNPLIYFGVSGPTFNHTVVPGQKYYVGAWLATSLNTLRARMILVASNGAVFTGPWEYINYNSGTPITDQKYGYPYCYGHGASLGPIPAGVTTARIGIEFEPTASETSVYVTAMSFHAEDVNSRWLDNSWALTGATYDVQSIAEITMNNKVDPQNYLPIWPGTSAQTTDTAWDPDIETDYIDLRSARIDQSATEGTRETHVYMTPDKVKISAETFSDKTNGVNVDIFGFAVGDYPDTRLEHAWLGGQTGGLSINNNQRRELYANAASTFVDRKGVTKNATFQEGGTLLNSWSTSSVWGTYNWSTFVPQNGGVYLFWCWALIPNVTNEVFVLELYEKNSNTQMASSAWIANRWEQFLTAVIPCSPGQEFYFSIYGNGLAAAMPVSAVKMAFVQLI